MERVRKSEKEYGRAKERVPKNAGEVVHLVEQRFFWSSLRERHAAYVQEERWESRVA